jgi:hypothetical protein
MNYITINYQNLWQLSESQKFITMMNGELV